MNNHLQSQREQEVRQDIVDMGKRLHMLGYVAGSDGNISYRLDENRILMTPAKHSLGFLRPNKLVMIDLKGHIISDGDGTPKTLRPSVEMRMHLEAYRQRPDVNAVIHAHPPMSIACTIAKISLTTCVLPEITYELGPIPTTPYTMPNTAERAKSIRELIKHHDAMLLDRHGTLTVGDSIFTAMMRLEWVEQAAKVMLAVRSAIGRTESTSLPVEQAEQLQVMRHRKLTYAGRRNTRSQFDVYAPFIMSNV